MELAAVLPFTFDYNLPVFTKDGGFPMIYPFRYWGDVLVSKAKAMIQEGIDKKEPFFAYVGISDINAQHQ
jgi:hypothetical protein